MIEFKELERTTELGYRFYKITEDIYYPSITSILGATVSEEKRESLKRWQDSLGSKKADKVLKDAGESGTAVHLLAERYLKKEPLKESEFNSKDINRFNALKIKLNLITDIIGQEVSLYSNKLELAGTCDCIAKYKNVLSIIDFKTCSRIKSDKDITDYKLQCCAYACMFSEMFNMEIHQGVILMTSNYFPQSWVFDVRDYIPELCKRIDLFYNNLSIYFANSF
jgi:genome maintenance exonuclease 1